MTSDGHILQPLGSHLQSRIAKKMAKCRMRNQNIVSCRKVNKNIANFANTNGRTYNATTIQGNGFESLDEYET